MLWSDPKLAELSREFVTVADEAYMLYPEHEWNLARVRDGDAHKFFKRFGESMPPGDWNEQGTKQGVYMIGPDGEYLEGRFAAGGFPDDMRARLQRALARWRQLSADKGYRNRPVPRVESGTPPSVASKPFVLHVYARDLPRSDGVAGQRFDPKAHRDRGFEGYLDWAWNESWLAIDPAAWRPTSGDAQPVDDGAVRELVCAVCVDNVRGQADAWRPEHVREVSLRMRRSEQGRIVYEGMVDLVDEPNERSFRGRIYGEATTRAGVDEIESFDLVIVGERRGQHRFNRREGDLGPAPIGFAVARHRP